ncbi:hypothetical protein FNU76_10680 [Chitinimonas arctica]|uniref:Uncharacterized protein n=1 Tax=Chitinimonas arctica TaxID=2594795 RepID=A0A516SF47_9NEIS|nr:hypothetical protein [Chitinimonas arctica]QDQ26791.1 hypothetical protein FNU76_10680 [Chitinimonas arctica]
MRLITKLVPLALCSAMAMAADPAPAAPKPAPPQWNRAVSVSVLIGADVPTGADARAFPSPLILRLNEPSRAAVINAADCVYEADAWANLSSERVIVTPRLLRCFDASGRELATKAVKGFAVDKDGFGGIKSPIAWGQAAKDLLLMGVGAQVKQNFLVRTAKSALGKASLGLTDNLMDDNRKAQPDGEAIRQVRSTETLLPTLSLEPGHEFNIVLSGQ